MEFSLAINADKLGKSLEDLAPALEEELQAAVKSLAEVAYANIIAGAQASNNDTFRRDYLAALKFESLGNSEYIIYLDGDWANKIEDGIPSYDMKQTHLKSQKTVEVGPRAGQPWVQTAKDGHKFAYVPMEHKPMSAKSGSLGEEIKYIDALNKKGEVQKVVQIFKDLDESPLSGKVFTADKANGQGISKNLEGLTKFQHVHESGAVTSLYMTWRVMSEHSKGWIHPGTPGLKLFEAAEAYVAQELDNIIKTLIP